MLVQPTCSEDLIPDAHNGVSHLRKGSGRDNKRGSKSDLHGWIMDDSNAGIILDNRLPVCRSTRGGDVRIQMLRVQPERLIAANISSLIGLILWKDDQSGCCHS